MGANSWMNSMFWRLVFRALRLRMQRVSVVFAALMVGAAIVTAMSAVYFDINAKMSQSCVPSARIFISARRGAIRSHRVRFSRLSTTRQLA